MHFQGEMINFFLKNETLRGESVKKNGCLYWHKHHLCYGFHSSESQHKYIKAKGKNEITDIMP